MSGGAFAIAALAPIRDPDTADGGLVGLDSPSAPGDGLRH